MPIHFCPVCGATHKVHPILHSLAYGRQLTCSPRCKTAFPRVICWRILTNAANDSAFAEMHLPEIDVKLPTPADPIATSASGL